MTRSKPMSLWRCSTTSAVKTLTVSVDVMRRTVQLHHDNDNDGGVCQFVGRFKHP